jgi:hypothetical protein
LEIYHKTLQEVDRQLAALHSSDDKRNTNKRELEDVQQQLKVLQDRLCEIAQILKSEFGVV